MGRNHYTLVRTVTAPATITTTPAFPITTTTTTTTTFTSPTSSTSSPSPTASTTSSTSPSIRVLNTEYKVHPVRVLCHAVKLSVTWWIKSVEMWAILTFSA